MLRRILRYVFYLLIAYVALALLSRTHLESHWQSLAEAAEKDCKEVTASCAVNLADVYSFDWTDAYITSYVPFDSILYLTHTKESWLDKVIWDHGPDFAVSDTIIFVNAKGKIVSVRTSNYDRFFDPYIFLNNGEPYAYLDVPASKDHTWPIWHISRKAPLLCASPMSELGPRSRDLYPYDPKYGCAEHKQDERQDHP